MSWFKRKPKLKEAPKRQPYYHSPAAERLMEEAKKTGPEKKKKSGS